MVFKSRQIKTYSLLKIAYLLFLVTAFFYVKSALDADSFKVTEKESKKKAVKVYNVSVKLIVDADGFTKEYNAKLTNMDTVEDFLSKLRDDQGLLYEVDMYTYGREIVSVFGKEADSGKKWAILYNDAEDVGKLPNDVLSKGVYNYKDITRDISNVNLSRKGVYILKQIDSL